jgi:acyl carrier protein
LGASSQDIDPDASLTEDLELSPVQIEDLLRYLAEKFNLEFDDLRGSYKTVNQIVENIEDLTSFE